MSDKEIGDLVEDEMKSTTDAIKQASARIQVERGDVMPGMIIINPS